MNRTTAAALCALLLTVTGCGDGSSEAEHRPSLCDEWKKKNAPELKRAAMLMSVEKLDGSRVDKRCLVRRVDELVRWMNLTCRMGLSREIFALSFVSKADEMCS